MSIHIFTIALFFIASHFCIAEKTRTCRVFFLEKPENILTEAFLFDGTNSEKITLASMNFSEVIVLPEGELVLSITPTQVHKSEEIPTGAPTVKIPENIRGFYLIIVQDPDNEVIPIRILPMNADDPYPKNGETLWINETQHTIKATIGDIESFTISPQSKVISEAALPYSGYYKAKFSYKSGEHDEFLPIMEKSWWCDPMSRNLGFIIDSGGRLPSIFTLRDRRAPESSDE